MNLKPILRDEDYSGELFSSPDCRQLLKIYEDYYPKTGFQRPWIGYFIINENKVVGSCSFTGKPEKGRVEIAYWTFKDYEGQGIASFACSELVALASQTDPALTITAKTAPEENASVKILRNNHFTFTESVQDDDIGEAWLWTYQKNHDS